MGHPINHSTHSGFSWPPSEAITAWSIRSFERSFPLLRFSAAGDDPLLALAHGVGHIRDDTASISVPPSRPLRGVIRPPLSARLAVGVGQSFAALDRPHPELADALGML
ncbi:hypothetical protein [Burkholderia pseudomallei]|uniref:hypothetical protein n=1 Tax=Burkholderia pseudomallei TaxID=28450 RepID=UPI00217F9E12|nr:hypothetical protein [Burkholderia pseudomallei]